MKHVWNIDKLLKNTNALQVRTCKNPTTVLYSKTTKTENSFDEKNPKQSHAYKGYASPYNVEILNSFNPELRLK